MFVACNLVGVGNDAEIFRTAVHAHELVGGLGGQVVAVSLEVDEAGRRHAQRLIDIRVKRPWNGY